MPQKTHGIDIPIPVSQGGTGSISGKVVPFTDSLFTAATANNTTSATFVDITGSDKSVSFPTGTENIVVSVNFTFFGTVTADQLFFRVVVGSTNGTTFNLFLGLASTHIPISFTEVFTGPISGSQTVKLQWARAAGSGTIHQDTQDMTTWSVLGFS